MVEDTRKHSRFFYFWFAPDAGSVYVEATELSVAMEKLKDIASRDSTYKATFDKWTGFSGLFSLDKKYRLHKDESQHADVAFMEDYQPWLKSINTSREAGFEVYALKDRSFIDEINLLAKLSGLHNDCED